MKYRELVKKVQDKSGFSDSEAENALRLIVNKLATRLTPGERKDFASQLPAELQDLALPAGEVQKFSADDMVQELSELQDINKNHAKKQILAVWEALKATITPGQISDIRNQLPRDLTAMMH